MIVFLSLSEILANAKSSTYTICTILHLVVIRTKTKHSNHYHSFSCSIFSQKVMFQNYQIFIMFERRIILQIACFVTWCMRIHKSKLDVHMFHKISFMFKDSVAWLRLEKWSYMDQIMMILLWRVNECNSTDFTMRSRTHFRLVYELRINWHWT
jgi:hypothetical protein